ncbi:MAG TPA: hypothetical protein VGK73_13220 [Polyangiaceae bacterium]
MSRGPALALAWIAVETALALVSSRSHAQEATRTPTPAAKTSLVWIVGDDDVGHAPSDVSPPSPGPSIGDRAGYDALFEGSSSRYTGRENRLELGVSGETRGFHPLLETRAALLLGVDVTSLGDREGSVRFDDAGSRIELFTHFSADVKRASDGIGARLYPLYGDRERLGETEALGVGGSVGPLRESPYATARGPVRAGRLWFELAKIRAYVVLKTASFAEPVLNAPAVEETSYGVFGGVESHWKRLVSFGFGAGYFEHGRIPGASFERAATAAASARLAFVRGLTAPRAPASFGNEAPPFDVRRETERAEGFAVGVEGAHIVQRLADFDHPGTTALAGARAFALLGTLDRSWLEVRLALLARDAGFVMRNAPGVFPGQTTPAGARELAELSALSSVGVRPFAPFSATLSLGVRRPAAVMTAAIDRLGQTTGATVVLEGPGQGELLPSGYAPVPVLDVRPELALRASRMLELLAWLGYRRDFNRARLVPDGNGSLTRSFADPDRISFAIAARAVW